MTQLESARSALITPEMEKAAEAEGIAAEELRAKVAAGTVVIPANRRHSGLRRFGKLSVAPPGSSSATPSEAEGRPIGIGAGLRVKVNANLGTSQAEPALEGARERLAVALGAKADTVMDLSTAGDLDEIRRALLRDCSVPLGTVPIYQAAVEALQRRGDITRMSEEDFFQVISKQAADGVDFITVHCGVTRATVEQIRSGKRICGVVSRGGAFTICWMAANEKENPLYEHFDRLLEICREEDVTLSLGDGLRPGSLADATDRPQVMETVILGELVERARAAGVQVMVEGPGHLPLDQVAANVVLEKSLCKGAPFYVLGPIVTDIAPGYDHITSAIGGALAAMAGADFLCYVTPAEHLGLPNAEEVREGVMAARIAAHAADVVRLGEKALARDREMAQARQALDWKRQFALAIDPERARKGYRPATTEGLSPKGCSMCGEYCVFSLLQPETASPRPGPFS